MDLYEFKANLVYIVSSRLPGATWQDPVHQKRKIMRRKKRERKRGGGEGGARVKDLLLFKILNVPIKHISMISRTIFLKFKI